MSTGRTKGETDPAPAPALPDLPGGRIAARRLVAGASHPVSLAPGPEALRALAAAIGARGLRKLRLEGVIVPEGRADWRLEARLGATVEQDCVVTLAPVRTRIETDLRRLYRAETPPLPAPGSETEMPDATEEEPLGAGIDLVALIAEELALAMPDYPRAPDAPEAMDLAALPEGAEETPKESPFAVLARLARPGPGDTER